MSTLKILNLKNNILKNSIVKVFCIIIFQIALLTGCANNTVLPESSIKEEDKLVIYTSHKEEIYGPIVREFEERTGIWVDVITGGTNEMLDRIKTEGNESADVMFGGGVDSLSVYSSCFESYKSNQADVLSNSYASESDSYTVFSKLPIVICYNTRLMHSAGKPRSWSDLLDGYWKGKIAFADPTKSGSSYTALYTLGQLTEDETGSFDKSIELFKYNLNGEVLSGSGDVMDKIISGEKVLGIVLEESALKEMAKNTDIGIIYPREGITAVPDGCAIVKNAKHMENAKLFLEFTVCDDVQRLLEDRLYRRSVRTDYDNSDIKEVIYNLNNSLKIRDELIEEFENEADNS